MVPPCSDRVSRAPPYSRIYIASTCTRLSLSKVSFSTLFQFFYIYYLACPISLATTLGVSFDFLSSWYLDVSVPKVRFINLCIQLIILIAQWVAPFRHLRIIDCSHLPTTFRRVPRLSSPLIAQASTRYPSFLDSQLCVYLIIYLYITKHTVYSFCFYILHNYFTFYVFCSFELFSFTHIRFV